jgi:hypothetical protein
VSDANRWGYCYVYDLLPRHFPDVLKRARETSGRQARETILYRYLNTVVAATLSEVRSLFGWEMRDVERTAAGLEGAGRLRAGVQIQGLSGEFLSVYRSGVVT